MSHVRSSPFVVDAVEEFLRTKQAREPKTYAAYRGVLLGSERAPSRRWERRSPRTSRTAASTP